MFCLKLSLCPASIPNIPQMVDVGDDAGSLHDDYPDDCDDYYGLSEDSDKDETILGLVVRLCLYPDSGYPMTIL